MSKKLDRQFQTWTPSEIDFLKQAWGMKSTDAIARKLNRSIGAVKVKANRLGLGPWIESSDKITVSELFKVLKPNVTTGGYSDFKRQLKLHKAPMQKVKVENQKILMIKIDDFWKWAEKHKHIVDFSYLEKNILGIEPKWVDEKRKNDFKQRFKRRNWSSIDEQRLVYMVQKGYSLLNISKELNRTCVALRKRIYMLGLKNPDSYQCEGKRYTQEEIEKMIELYNAGYSIDNIAKAINRLPGPVQNHITYLRTKGYGFNLTGRQRSERNKCV